MFTLGYSTVSLELDEIQLNGSRPISDTLAAMLLLGVKYIVLCTLELGGCGIVIKP